MGLSQVRLEHLGGAERRPALGANGLVLVVLHVGHGFRKGRRPYPRFGGAGGPVGGPFRTRGGAPPDNEGKSSRRWEPSA